MPITVALIVISLAFYVYYKAKYVQSKREIQKKWLSAKSSISLGLFVVFFGINTIFIHPSTISYVVAVVFILVGGGSSWAGYQAYKHYLPLAIAEAKE